MDSLPELNTDTITHYGQNIQRILRQDSNSYCFANNVRGGEILI